MLEGQVHTHAGPVVPPPNLQTIHHTVDVGYYAQAARTTLNPYMLLVFICLYIEYSLTIPKLILS
jgi:hypothetical protein